MPSPSEKIAIPRFAESIAPCFGYSTTIAMFTVVDGQVSGQSDFTLRSEHALDRVRLLRDQGVDTLICGGLQDRVQDLITATGIRVISWVDGNVEDLLRAYLDGRLQAPAGTPQPAPRRP